MNSNISKGQFPSPNNPSLFLWRPIVPHVVHQYNGMPIPFLFLSHHFLMLSALKSNIFHVTISASITSYILLHPHLTHPIKSLSSLTMLGIPHKIWWWKLVLGTIKPWNAWKIACWREFLQEKKKFWLWKCFSHSQKNIFLKLASR